MAHLRRGRVGARIDRRRLPGRQLETEHCAAPRAVRGGDRAAVRGDDRLGDRQPKPDAALRGLELDAVELVEKPGLLAGRKAGTTVGDLDGYPPRQRLRRQLDRRSRRGVLGRVLQQVGKDLLDQHRIDIDQRQIGGKHNLDAMLRQSVLHTHEDAADEFLERRPLPRELGSARLEPCHVEQVIDQHRDPPRLVVNGRSQLAPRRLGQRIAAVDQARRCSDQHGEGSAKIVRDR